MNFKALIKTFTPSGEFLFAIGMFILIIAVLCAILAGLTSAIIYVLGEKIFTMILLVLVIGFYSWICIIEPLVDRYKLIKWQLEQNNDRV